jgi:hypothetical protein
VHLLTVNHNWKRGPNRISGDACFILKPPRGSFGNFTFRATTNTVCIYTSNHLVIYTKSTEKKRFHSSHISMDAYAGVSAINDAYMVVFGTLREGGTVSTVIQFIEWSKMDRVVHLQGFRSLGTPSNVQLVGSYLYAEMTLMGGDRALLRWNLDGHYQTEKRAVMVEEGPASMFVCGYCSAYAVNEHRPDQAFVVFRRGLGFECYEAMQDVDASALRRVCIVSMDRPEVSQMQGEFHVKCFGGRGTCVWGCVGLTRSGMFGQFFYHAWSDALVVSCQQFFNESIVCVLPVDDDREDPRVFYAVVMVFGRGTMVTSRRYYELCRLDIIVNDTPHIQVTKLHRLFPIGLYGVTMKRVSKHVFIVGQNSSCHFLGHDVRSGQLLWTYNSNVAAGSMGNYYEYNGGNLLGVVHGQSTDRSVLVWDLGV